GRQIRHPPRRPLSYARSTSLRASSAIAYTPRPATAGRGRGPTRQRWEGEGRPVPWRGAARENGGSLAARRGEERGNRDAPHPPIASQWAPPSPRFAGERCTGGAWPRYGGPKICAYDSGFRRDDGLRLPECVCMKLWQTIAKTIEAHGTCAMVSLVEVEGSAPREPGARMIVTPHGFHGTIGGGALEWRAIAAAQARLGEGTSAMLTSQALGPELGQCCGGRVRLLTEVFDRSRLPEVKALAAEEERGAFATEGAILTYRVE